MFGLEGLRKPQETCARSPSRILHVRRPEHGAGSATSSKATFCDGSIPAV